MSRVSLDYDTAHTFVEKHPSAFWDGWDIVIPSPTPHAFSNPKGIFHKGRWAMAYRVSYDDNGVWNVNHKSVR